MASTAHTNYNTQNRTQDERRKAHIKCLQLNLQHSRVATANLTQIILHNNIDVAFVQEPYTILNIVAGFPKNFKIFTCGRDRIRSAIIVNNNDLDAIAITQASHEDAILTEFRYEGLKFY